MRRLTKEYRSFHGHDPRYERQVPFTPPKSFVLLGEAVAVEYRCDKLAGGGDGKNAVYRHSFDKGAILVMDQTRRQLFILGSKIRVTSAGITH
jgi:hypothetical protein